MPDRAKNMGDGWETKRRPRPGHATGRSSVSARRGSCRRSRSTPITTRATIPIARRSKAASRRARRRATCARRAWSVILPETKLSANKRHFFSGKQLQHAGPCLARAAQHLSGRRRQPPAHPWHARTRLTPRRRRPRARSCSRACGSTRWVDRMMARRPFGNDARLLSAARIEWFGLTEADWLEAFSHHPRIGDRASLEARFPATHDLSSKEQAGVGGADADVIAALAEANERYFDRFGFIFIVCATGKSAEEMLALLRDAIAERSRHGTADRGGRAGEDYRASAELMYAAPGSRQDGGNVATPWKPLSPPSSATRPTTVCATSARRPTARSLKAGSGHRDRRRSAAPRARRGRRGAARGAARRPTGCSSESARHARRRARPSSDRARARGATLRDDREAADETLELERVETARMLRGCCPTNATQTDDHLARRARSLRRRAGQSRRLPRRGRARPARSAGRRSSMSAAVIAKRWRRRLNTRPRRHGDRPHPAPYRARQPADRRPRGHRQHRCGPARDHHRARRPPVAAG